MSITFQSGDRVRHPGRPEWGVGVVESAQGLSSGGQSFQKLGLRFERAGRKTISTQHVSLESADSPSPAGVAAPAPEVSAEDAKSLLEKLPSAATDPLLPLAGRLEATLLLYRFTAEGGSLLDWASTQTKLADPLSALSRPELELSFQRFRRDLDQHLARLFREAIDDQPELLGELAAAAPAEGALALRRIIDAR